jgi:hypothetical protein
MGPIGLYITTNTNFFKALEANSLGIPNPKSLPTAPENVATKTRIVLAKYPIILSAMMHSRWLQI